MKFKVISVVVSCILSQSVLATDVKIANPDSAAFETLTDAVTATTDTIEISNFSDYGLALKSCNDTLARLSMLSNDKVQITGSCVEDGLYVAKLKARVTILK